MSIIPHKQPKPGVAKTPKKKAPTPAAEPESFFYDPVYLGLTGVEEALAQIANSIKSYAAHAYQGENKLAIFTGPEGSDYHPVLIALESSDAMDRVIEASERLATAFERIATALERK